MVPPITTTTTTPSPPDVSDNSAYKRTANAFLVHVILLRLKFWQWWLKIIFFWNVSDTVWSDAQLGRYLRNAESDLGPHHGKTPWVGDCSLCKKKTSYTLQSTFFKCLSGQCI
jgi:hypothetical protein